MEGESRTRYYLQPTHTYVRPLGPRHAAALSARSWGASGALSSVAGGGLTGSVCQRSRRQICPGLRPESDFSPMFMRLKEKWGKSGKSYIAGNGAEHMLYLLINSLKKATDGNVLQLSEQLYNQST